MRAARRDSAGPSCRAGARAVLDPRRKRLLACDDDGLCSGASPPPKTFMIASPVAPQWVIHPRRDHELALVLARDLGAPLPAAVTLVNRGVDTAVAARRFLEPSLEDLHDPLTLLDLEAAVTRIRRAVDSGERIM